MEAVEAKTKQEEQNGENMKPPKSFSNPDSPGEDVKSIKKRSIAKLHEEIAALQARLGRLQQSPKVSRTARNDGEISFDFGFDEKDNVTEDTKNKQQVPQRRIPFRGRFQEIAMGSETSEKIVK